jgi:hypothetical protein
MVALRSQSRTGGRRRGRILGRLERFPATRLGTASAHTIDVDRLERSRDESVAALVDRDPAPTGPARTRSAT